MKYLLFFLLFSVSVSATEFHEQTMTGFGTVPNNGTITNLGTNSWQFLTHTSPWRFTCTYSYCRKVGVKIDSDSWVQDRIDKYSFDFTLLEYPAVGADWTIVFQNWYRIDPDDENGNHPVTTLKLRQVAGKVYLQQYENSWQFDRSYFDPLDPLDANHNHGLEVKRGEIEIVVGKKYAIDLIVGHGHTVSTGHVTLKVDGNIRSDSVYQTKSLTESGIIYIGHYWSKEALTDAYQIKTKMENFTSSITY